MGTRAANLVVTYNAPGSPRNVSLSGTGLSPQQAVLNPGILFFGVQNGGTTSAPQTITLTNPGIATLHIASITAGQGFNVTNTCGGSLVAGAQCSIAVTFTPLLNGGVQSNLTVADDASNSPQQVGRNGTGTGVTTGASVSPLNLNVGLVSIKELGSQQVTITGPLQTITITSTGNGYLGGISYIPSGPNVSDFSIGNNCYGNVLPGANCTIVVSFTPGGVGLRTATLQLIPWSTTPGLPQTVTLTGTGFLQTNAIRGGPGYLRVSADFDGDGKADLAVWRPNDGTWHIVPSSHPAQPIVVQWGLQGDVPVPGDYDGDGKADVAVWRPSNGNWYIIPSSHPSSPIVRQWGQAGDIPLVGDFDGDGKADLAVWRQALGQWRLILSSKPSAPVIRQWGLPADIPLTGDFDGDGKADFAIGRPSNTTWYIIPSGNPSSPIVKQWGASGDTPVAADFDGDGETDLAVWRPLDGTWLVIPSSAPSSPVKQQWGPAGDIPVPGDFDGDGKADYAVWTPSSATWKIQPTSHPSSTIMQVWGARQDVVLTGDFVGYGISSLTSWHPNTGVWTVAPGSPDVPTTIVQQWGELGDIPLLGDFDGDGKADFTVWRPSNGTWYVRRSSYPSVPLIRQWGTAGGIPLIGDFDGDGKADFSIWRPSNGTWYVIPSSNPAVPIVQSFGISGDVPAVFRLIPTIIILSRRASPSGAPLPAFGTFRVRRCRFANLLTRQLHLARREIYLSFLMSARGLQRPPVCFDGTHSKGW